MGKSSIEPNAATIRLSVRELIAFVMRSGDIDRSFFRTEDRMRQGRQIHKTRQDSYGENFLKEVTLKNTTIIEEMRFEVKGRCDGLCIEKDRVLIEEIKSTTRQLDEMCSADYPTHWAQVKCYGYFYCAEHDLPEITLRLTYIHLETSEVQNYEESFSYEELEIFYHLLLERYLNFSRLLVEFRERRNDSLNVLTFPYDQYRPGQREMAGLVYHASIKGKALILEAPTGIGKTISSLFPALKALSSGQKDCAQKIFYLTSKDAVKKQAMDTMMRLHQRDLQVKTVVLTAKEKLCLNDRVKCTPEACPYARGHFDRINDALMDIYEHENLMGFETIREYSKKHRVCPIECQFDLAVYADVIICDYNYVFDPIVSLERFFGDVVDPYIFLIDEAHNLLDRGRHMYSEIIHIQEIDDLAQKLEDDFSCRRLHQQLNLLALLAKKQSSVGLIFPDELSEQIDATMTEMNYFLLDKKKHVFYDDVEKLYFELFRFYKISDYFDEMFRLTRDHETEGLVLNLRCLDIRPLFKKLFRRAYASILFSATLTPIGFYRHALGLDGAPVRHLASPFDPKNLKVAIVPISVRYRSREKHHVIYAQILHQLLCIEGNTLVFFPSYTFMNRLYDDVKGDFKIIRQTSDMSLEDKEKFIERFESSNHKAFAVLGGSFSESIDLIGERLETVIVWTVGMPGLGLERDLMRHYYDRKGQNGFAFSYIYPGMNKVQQAAGRVIRSDEDRGQVVLIDDRYLSEPYRSLLPSYWRSPEILPHYNAVCAFVDKVNRSRQRKDSKGRNGKTSEFFGIEFGFENIRQND